MKETVAQYTSRIAAHMEGKEPLPVLSATVPALTALIEQANEKDLVSEPAPGKWAVRDVLAHLADAEIANSWRYRQMLAKSGIALGAWNQDEWAQVGDYRHTDAHDSLALLESLRTANLRLLTQLSPEQWETFGIHEERGKLTLRDLVRQIAGHDLNHVEQVRQLLGLSR